MSLREDVVDRQQRAGKHQSLFREVNERVKDINDRFHVFSAVGDWVCECANDTCTQRIKMTGDEYEHIRAAGERFLIAPSDEHLWPDVEHVVERHANYWVVEKIELGAKIAKHADPRSGGPVPLRT